MSKTGELLPARLAWALESYDVVTPQKEKKRILEPQSDALHAGEMFLIVGPSGSGKTSLLRILAGRHAHGDWQGTLVADGAVADRSPRRSTGYVDQHPLFFSTLTPRETLTFTARLRLPHASSADVATTVNRVLAELNLGKCASTYVGDERLKGISGGEKKRLQVAAEMVADPSCLLLDEPTSGLDSATALLTCRTLSRLARSPEKRAVLAVVHQPRASLLQLFDRVVALSDGRPVYAGPPGDLLAHFESVGAPCPAHENPADHLLDLVAIPDEVAGGDQTGDELEASVDDLRKRKVIAKQVADAYLTSPGARDSKDRFAAAKSQATAKTTVTKGVEAGWLHQFNVLLQRAWLYKTRDEMIVVTQVTMACLMALLLGAIFFQQGLSQASVQSRVGAISFSMLLMAFIAFDVVLLFPKERDLYTRESQAGLYGASAFFHARCLAELPGHLVAGGAYATIAYWMMGFQDSAMKFSHFFFLCEAVVFAGTSLLIFCGCCARDFEMANNYATVFFCLFMMFDGHYINNKSIPKGAKWIEDANFFNWAISAGSRSELLGLGDLHGCSDPESSRCVFRTGGDAVDYYGFRNKPFSKAIVAILLISVALRTLAFIAFKCLFTGRPIFAARAKK